ncbi:rho guanine nucleotide exchange factor 37 isoform X1 [Stegostoma tigrinum]|uniref:rho guanine nucleotide exchange factor 37 isoform X1 n=1 Tax=Stegostoma tigrinum TaxID=3053191 RepID=UPI00202B8651|nr:rho guanine nucleotide exchange factor 37 isoform X1 [Stegostoma tigrinum]XP_048399880.1 rho guanine nucleotide exchange factor 37 isoform X1 [Stegostoma tigrinum]XP_048399881.1 rho guanine nucleotide exchange factor 37 isoform X1 [Stegostoma tigrinum]XP_048399882.1 rho guanine nucleotide exchange factor 37 isoform X1 [Stegostoma tigrinum]XP_048399883.1 rho guanine nucleotide exchange factor 37 isoform X1 [Stegostoma tigrinum]XP_048399884.1 rho guanine nucleotide exchange factor 37 isoform 
MDDSSYEELNGKFTSASKMEEKQMKAIKELVETEKRYFTLLHLCATDIRNHLQFKQVPELDLEGLFGGTDEVLHVSSNLLKNLEDAATGKSDQVLLISNVFLAFKQELEDAYKEYCANYENMLQLETNYKKNEIIWKEIAETLNEVGAHTGAITLTFFLVTPVQRIGKYPLLLKTVLENTAPSDEGYTALEKATVAMQELNYNINEYKRLKEVVTKYSRQENLSLRDTIGRINKHSIAKKASRLSQVIKHETGILPKVKDKDYDDSVKLFYIIEKNVTTLKKNTESFITNMEHFQNLRSYHYVPNLVEEHTTICYQEFIQILHQMIIPEFKRRLKSIIYEPLCALSNLFSSPQQLVKKHNDKFLDYEKIQEKIKEEGNASYEEKAAVETYKALHSLLLTELPKFNSIVLQLHAQILQAVMTIHRDLANNVLQFISQHLHEFLFSSKDNFWQQTEETLQKSSVKLEMFCQIFESMMEQAIEQPYNEEKLETLLKKYSPEKIYQVTSNVSGNKELDLTLQRGDLVALLQSTDTRGNTNRWLVDSGGHRGFVPGGKLSPLQPGKHLNNFPLSQCSSVGHIVDGAMSRRKSSPSPERPLCLLPEPMQYEVIAAYQFTARGPHEASLQPGQPVKILEAHDKKGNNEWYLVEVNGQRGYVPSNYLVKVPCTGWRKSFAL